MFLSIGGILGGIFVGIIFVLMAMYGLYNIACGLIGQFPTGRSDCGKTGCIMFLINTILTILWIYFVHHCVKYGFDPLSPALFRYGLIVLIVIGYLCPILFISGFFMIVMCGVAEGIIEKYRKMDKEDTKIEQHKNDTKKEDEHDSEDKEKRKKVTKKNPTKKKLSKPKKADK